MSSRQPRPLREQLLYNGEWLFRWRSYLPIVFLVLLLPGFYHFSFPFGSRALDELWQAVCLAVSLFGLAIRVHTIGHVPRHTSGRHTRVQAADRLNCTGMYSIVRNPLYLGNFFMWIGVSMYVRHWWLTSLVALLFALYHERIIIAEEAFLEKRFGEKFHEWANRTPAALPRLKNWIPPDLPFCWRTVLHREYHGFFAIISLFTAMEAVAHYRVNGQLMPDLPSSIVFALCLAVYLVLRLIRKRTTWLIVEGR